MHYFYRNYTDWYYCYDSMRSGSDAHISNRHCRLILSLRYHCLCPTFNQYREMVDIFLHLQIEQMFAFLSGYGIIITKQNRLHCWFECPAISLSLQRNSKFENPAILSSSKPFSRLPLRTAEFEYHAIYSSPKPKIVLRLRHLCLRTM